MVWTFEASITVSIFVYLRAGNSSLLVASTMERTKKKGGIGKMSVGPNVRKSVNLKMDRACYDWDKGEMQILKERLAKIQSYSAKVCTSEEEQELRTQICFSVLLLAYTKCWKIHLKLVFYICALTS